MPSETPATADLLAAFSADQLALGRSARTVDSYAYRLADFLAHLAGRVGLVEVNRADVAGYHDALRARGYSASTAKGRLCTLLVFYRFCARRDLIAAVPAIPLPKVPRNPPVHVLSPHQVVRILAQPDLTRKTGIRDRAVLEVLYSTAIRLGELRALRLEHVDFAGGFLTVERGKGDRWRVVPIGTTALDCTRRYLDEVRPAWVRSEAERTLFVSDRGHGLAVTTVQQRIVWRYAEAAAIPFRVTTHAFRHAAATHLLRGDGRDRRAGLLQVRDMLGHDSADTTRIYTRVEITDLERELALRHFRDRRR
jgi:integrase/recombinase XerD